MRSCPGSSTCLADVKGEPSHPRGKLTLAGSRRANRITSWLQDAVIKIGSALSSPMTSSMRNFGARRDKRRPDVRFCGVEAAGEEGLGLTRQYQRSGLHVG